MPPNLDVKTYDPRMVALIIDGVQITGFAEEKMIAVKTHGDINKVVGADGEVARSMSANRTVDVTISLLETSQTNDFLSNLHELDINTGNGMVTFLLKDLNGTTLISAKQCWVKKYPEKDYTAKVKEIDWIIETGQADMFMGGNN
jgi:Protein of unknown function (DUF3277)